MEQRKTWIYGILCYVLSFTLTFYIGECREVNKSKKTPFFHRHHDCLVTLFHNGHIINTTLVDGVQHLENVTVQFLAFGHHFVVDLNQNKQLFTETYVEKLVHSNGQTSESTQTANKENCYYHGKLRFHSTSEAALSTCHGLTGYITNKYETYHIEPLNGRIHRVYRNQDQKKLSLRCGTEGHDSRLHSHQTVVKRHKRSIELPYDSNINTRYVELYLVNDYRTFERHGKKTDIIIKRSQDIANIVSSLYRQLNIYVVLVGVEVWVGGDQVSVTVSADNTMENFLRYRKERINPYHHNDNAQLITGIFFEHGVVGKAIKGPICTHQYSGGVNMDYGGVVTLVATTVAHEMGHNFGMEHDNDTMCECRDDKCIMAATSGQISPKRWSSCSQNALAEAFDLGMDYCLRNLPTSVYGGPICGNGLKEDGEDCDCGLKQDCANRCCNATSCKMFSAAQCASGMCCDFDSCKVKEASTMCRAPTGECDLGEFCDGVSENCPADVFVQNGVSCKHGQSYCYNGQCNTHTEQCKLLWGDSGRVSDPICFQQLNMNGNNDGNCGFNWTTVKYKRCDKENVMCGLLHCVHLNEKLMFWRDNLAIDMRASFLSRGNKQYVCRSAMLDVGLDMPDPGFVPDGAKCEQDKICINQQCVPLAKLNIEQCADNCHGHGLCNSKGNCHCHSGYGPPFCDRPGYGGSIDSGPASNEYETDSFQTSKKDVLITVLVVLLLIVPLIIVAVVAFLKRKQLEKWWQQIPSLKYRVGNKKPKCKPSSDSSSSIRKEFSTASRDRENLIFNPQGAHTTESKTKVWNSHTSHSPAAVPPERPKQPPSVLKPSSSESKNTTKKVKLSLPIQETGGPPSPSKQKKPLQFGSEKLEASKGSQAAHSSNSIVKRESFRGSEISEPVLVCTTNRNSLVLADGNVDIIGPEAKLVTGHKVNAVSVKRSQSDRPVSKPEVHRPVIVPPPPGNSTLKKSASARSPTKVNPPVTSSVAGSKGNTSGFRPRPVPPIPTEEEDDTQPIYTNETTDMSDLLSAIDGVLKDSSTLYSNMSGSVQTPIQETSPPAPPRSTPAIQPLPPKPPSSTATSKPVRPAPNKVPDVSKINNKSASLSFNIERDNTTQVTDTKVSSQDSSKPAAELKSTKPNTGVKSKRDISSENSDKIKGAVSDELRSKIINRSSPPKSSSTLPAKPGFHKPLAKQNSSSGQQSTSSVTSKPTKTDNEPIKAISSKNIPSSSTINKQSNVPKTSVNNRTIADIKSSLAARSSSPTNSSTENDGKKVSVRKVSEAEKSVPSADKTKSAKPEGSQITRVQSMTTNRPSLPPKPDSSNAPGAQPKRVQSFRI
ncbi:disintegrin and metalloproteinase domain-containing protein 9-like isoform X1 [Biomphalaria glabrata]|uniref:Disintegrin and metalloproteinase domain-containing protein 9-like isoform X1 n=1 Tax=Biomphalaria glabrata TaxID=6526 RepID=A0A9W2ZGF3_BIOGL|nr:disintegrin and metalloproteinase domain-containing protein 9-like isoform X1 [Biomphalaria glabrata]